MVSKALTQCISLLMLLIVALGTTTSVIGEFRSHSLSAMSAIDIDHAHSHSSSHSHNVDGEYLFHHDASNHNHTYDSATLKALSHSAFTRVMALTYCRQVSGTPFHNPFKIERPPRTLLFT
jgi:ABC-type nickel/cobalt efflux system permease component RcnA